MRKAARLLDATYTASLDPDTHLAGLIRPLYDEDKPRPATTMSPCPEADPCGYHHRVETIIEACGIHQHRATCHKCKSCLWCRMCFPRERRAQTEAVQLSVVEETGEDGKKKRCLHVHDHVEELDHSKVRDRDMASCPFAPQREEIIVVQLKRPELFKDLDFDQMMADTAMPLQLRNRLLELTPEARDWLLNTVKGRNGNVVEVSRTITAALACNTCVYPLGGIEQAKATMFYLVSYIVKNVTELHATLSVFLNSAKHVRDHPSTAQDSGTDQRTGMHIIQRTINSMTGAQELPAMLGAMVGMRRSRFHCNRAFVYTCVTGAVAWVKHHIFGDRAAWDDREADGGGDEDEGGDEEEEGDDHEEDDEGTAARNTDTQDSRTDSFTDRLARIGRSRSTKGFGTCRDFYVTDARGHTTKLLIYPAQLFANRGPRLAHLNWYEYWGTVIIVAINRKKPARATQAQQQDGTNSGDGEQDTDSNSDEEEDEGDAEEGGSTAPAQRGRRPNFTADFATGFSLHGHYVQRLQSKQHLPILGNGPPPPPPTGPRPRRAGDSHTNICSHQCLHAAPLPPPNNNLRFLCK